MITRAERRERAKTNVGRRCHWLDEGTGTITGVLTVQGGWSAYLIEWDDDCPPWWSTRISTAHGPSFVID